MPGISVGIGLLGRMLESRSSPAMSFRPLSPVIPSVAEESEMPALDSISGFLDSSATLGMTGGWERNDMGGGLRFRAIPFINRGFILQRCSG